MNLIILGTDLSLTLSVCLFYNNLLLEVVRLITDPMEVPIYVCIGTCQSQDGLTYICTLLYQNMVIQQQNKKSLIINMHQPRSMVTKDVLPSGSAILSNSDCQLVSMATK